WALVSACWLVRVVAFFLLVGTLGLGDSLSVALLFLCAGAAGAACRSARPAPAALIASVREPRRRSRLSLSTRSASRPEQRFCLPRSPGRPARLCGQPAEGGYAKESG